MTASDKKKAQLLVGLLVIAGLTWFLVYRTGPSTSVGPKKKPAKAAVAKQIKDPTIRIDLLGAATGTEEVGRKNIFQYRQKPLPPVVSPPPRAIPTTQTTTTNTGVIRQEINQPPPFKAFKYEGFSIIGHPKTGVMRAVLSEGTNTYQVTQGECLMGQYCVRQITENLIEIEDLLLKQRKSFTRTPPQ